MTRRLSLCLAFTCAALRAQGESSSDRIAAYGRVWPEGGVITVAMPTFQGAPPTVTELFVKEGDWVSRGQKLAVLQSEPLAAADLAAAKARARSAGARLQAVSAGPKAEDVAAQKESIKSAEAELKALKARKAPDTTAGKNEEAAHEDAAQAKVEMSQHQFAAMSEARPADAAIAQAEVDEAAAAVARAEVMLASTEVTAPMDGQALRILTHVGETGAGLVEIANTRSMVIKAELNAGDAPRVKVGAHAKIRSDGWPGEISGTVARISPLVSRSNLTALSTFANVDRQIVEATITPEASDKLSALTGAEATVSIAREPVTGK